MPIFYVFQNKSYKEEMLGGFVWSPQKDINQNNNRGYLNMTKINKNDYILHGYKQKIVAISVAKSGCYEEAIPSELNGVKHSWGKKGYKVDLEYFVFREPLNLKEHRQWLQDNHSENGPFKKDGKGKEQYMCTLPDYQAIYLLKNILKKQQDVVVENCLDEIQSINNSEYSGVELEQVNDNVFKKKEEISTKISKQEKQQTRNSEKNNKIVPVRNIDIAKDALSLANFKCEFDIKDRTFIRKNGVPYTEPHHLIPISKYDEFEFSLDVKENIISLCSHCHNLVHYGEIKEKEKVLLKVYNERKEKLKEYGIGITFSELMDFYK